MKSALCFKVPEKSAYLPQGREERKSCKNDTVSHANEAESLEGCTVLNAVDIKIERVLR